VEPLLVEALPFGSRERLLSEVGQRRPLPERERLAQERGGRVGPGDVELARGTRDQRLEALEVELTRVENDPVEYESPATKTVETPTAPLADTRARLGAPGSGNRLTTLKSPSKASASYRVKTPRDADRHSPDVGVAYTRSQASGASARAVSGLSSGTTAMRPEDSSAVLRNTRCGFERIAASSLGSVEMTVAGRTGSVCRRKYLA